MLSESRKRPHTDDDSTNAPNKRHLSANASPHHNGVAHDEPTLDNLELFRKEAIFRRMRHYSRENERSQSRIAELEHRKNTCEAGYAAIVACWTQLVDTIRLLVKPEDLPQVDIDTEDLFSLAKHLPEESSEELSSALDEKATATQTLVSSFVRLRGQTSASQLLENNIYVDCQKAATAHAALQSTVSLLRSQLQDCENQRDKYAAELEAAENRVERLCSKSVQALEARKGVVKSETKRDESEEQQQKPSSPSQSVTPPLATLNGVHEATSELEVLIEQIQSREAKVVELEKELAAQREKYANLQAECSLKDNVYIINDNEAYKAVVSLVLKNEQELAEKYKETQTLKDDVRRLTTFMEQHDTEILAAASKQVQELQTMLQKRDADNARLREQRDQQNAELVERRHKDSVKLSSLEQLKSLADNRAERIAQLISEVNQCKTHLAAHTGDKRLMMSFLHGTEEDQQRWEVLREQLKQAERRIEALEQTISTYSEDASNLARSHAESLQQISLLTEELGQYRAWLGLNHSPDVNDLIQLLKDKEAENEKLRLLEMRNTEAEKSLYGELDRLSAAWEALDKQVKSKVFDLGSMEERLSKSIMDKAKAENKYYAAMRDKEALEIEKKSLQRSLEKQGKAVERLVDHENSLQGQVNLLEKETATQKKVNDTLKEAIRALERSNAEHTSRIEQEKMQANKARFSLQEHERAMHAKNLELRAQEDSLIRAKRDMERQLAKIKEASLNVSANKEGSEVDNLMALLKCSTCRINFRSTIITKCMHTFCKDCVDKRIATRQRKCPACNLTFAQSDVQQFWFQ